jgi:hypothetical protein
MQTPLTPEFRTWLDHERAWARYALRAITDRRELSAAEVHPMERFGLRMSVVNLTGAVAHWAHGLCAGLEKVGHVDGLEVLAAGPPFSSADITQEDFDRLEAFVESGVSLIEVVLALDARDRRSE